MVAQKCYLWLKTAFLYTEIAKKCNNFYKAIPKFSCIKPTLGQKFLQAIDYICQTFILYSKWLQKVHILYNNVHLVLLTINWK